MPNMQPKGGMNVDDLVKRIEAKIAELEAEEKQLEIKKPVVEERKFKREEITDNQFFDDFF